MKSEDDPIVAARFRSMGSPVELCAFLDGQVIQATDQAFFALMPPHDDKCTCVMEQLRESQIKRMKIPKFKKPPKRLVDKADGYFIPKELL